MGENARKAVNILQKAGFEAYIVGGCVRDSLRNVLASDWDITTSAIPEEMMLAFKGFKIIETGLKHGTVTVVMENENVEITTFRVDGEYSDLRHPNKVKFVKKLEDDLKRRDFTINAMAYNEKVGLKDFFGGVEDVKNEIIRCVGDPEKRFSEDALRILRAVRFMAQTGFSIEEKTFNAMKRSKHLLDDVSKERIAQEFSKMLTARYVGRALRYCREIISEIVPEIQDEFDCKQHSPHHVFDVWEHTVRAVEMSDNKLEIRLAMFYHDIGKPGTRVFDKTGRGHFYGHAKLSAYITEKSLKRLRFSNEIIKSVVFLVVYHDYDLGDNDKILRRRIMIMGEENVRRLIKVKKADGSGKGIDYSSVAYLLRTEKRLENIIEQKHCVSLKSLDINGNDLVLMGYKGIQIGEKLKFLLLKVIDNPELNKKEKLIEILRKEA